jgi:pyruvate formate lyase activating enzyme
VVSSYNEPLITAEWAVEVFQPAREQGLLTGFVSNGNATAEALDFIRPLTDCYKIDLKTMNDRRYRQLGGVLDHVLDAIGLVHQRGIWLEVLTLVVPGFSDDPVELRAAARYIAGIDRSIPWHVTAFHEDYGFRGMGNTAVTSLIRACEIGAEEGLQFVYAGNAPGRVGRWEHTWCPGCQRLLVERVGYLILSNRIAGSGQCPDCGTRIPGIFTNPHGSSTPSRDHGTIRALRGST